MVGMVVRDRAWRTLAPSRLIERASHDRWTVAARTPVGSALLLWRLAFLPRASGMDVHVKIRARGDVVTNRTGLVVLLPAMTFAGAPFVVRHTDASEERGELPRQIAAHQPMLDVVGLRVSVPGGPALALTFEGDTFEMEDQRNWLDPSFKLYNRPLSRPFPYRIPDGAEIEQRIGIDVVRMPTRRATRAIAWIGDGRGVRRDRPAPMPELGIATAPARVPRRAEVVDALRTLRPDFVLHLTDSHASGLRAAARLARGLEAELRVESFGDSKALADALRAVDPQCVAPYFSGPLVNAALSDTHTQRTGGTFADFVMLNRNGLSGSPRRATFALCPTVHARDDRSLIETVEAMPAVFAQARRIAGGRPLDVGPCSLLRRLVPLTGKPAVRGPAGSNELYDIDPRQHEHLAAAWLACVIAIAADTGIASVCTFEAEGPRGLVYRSTKAMPGRRVAVLGRSSSYRVLDAFADIGANAVTLFDVRPGHGAAFLVHGEWQELWLVDLIGARRRLPGQALATGHVLHLRQVGEGGRWSALPTAGRIESYAIARVASPRATRTGLRSLARAWCLGDGDR